MAVIHSGIGIGYFKIYRIKPWRIVINGYGRIKTNGLIRARAFWVYLKAADGFAGIAQKKLWTQNQLIVSGKYGLLRRRYRKYTVQQVRALRTACHIV